jgi:ubiquinone/menaquinone biosynthesis C-methylase UbiE
LSASAHSLATELATQAPRGNLLLVGIGNGRNLPPLLTRLDQLTVVDADARRLVRATGLLPPDGPPVRFVAAAFDQLPFASASFAGMLSTHILQHGTVAEITSITRELARVAQPDAHCYFALASQRDQRCGQGQRISDNCWTPSSGDEIGVPHSYFDEAGIHELFARHFIINTLEEYDADALVGSWAHGAPSGIVHWFVRAARSAMPHHS